MAFKLSTTRSITLDYGGEAVRVVHRIASLDDALKLEALQVEVADKEGDAGESKRDNSRAVLAFASTFILAIQGPADEDDAWEHADFDGKIWSDLGKEERAEIAWEHFTLMSTVVASIVPSVTRAQKKKSGTS